MIVALTGRSRVNDPCAEVEPMRSTVVASSHDRGRARPLGIGHDLQAHIRYIVEHITEPRSPDGQAVRPLSGGDEERRVARSCHFSEQARAGQGGTRLREYACWPPHLVDRVENDEIRAGALARPDLAALIGSGNHEASETCAGPGPSRRESRRTARSIEPTWPLATTTRRDLDTLRTIRSARSVTPDPESPSRAHSAPGEMPRVAASSAAIPVGAACGPRADQLGEGVAQSTGDHRPVEVRRYLAHAQRVPSTTDTASATVVGLATGVAALARARPPPGVLRAAAAPPRAT